MKTIQKKELGFPLQDFSQSALRKENLKMIKGGTGATQPNLAGPLGSTT